MLHNNKHYTTFTTSVYSVAQQQTLHKHSTFTTSVCNAAQQQTSHKHYTTFTTSVYSAAQQQTSHKHYTTFTTSVYNAAQQQTTTNTTQHLLPQFVVLHNNKQQQTLLNIYYLSL